LLAFLGFAVLLQDVSHAIVQGDDLVVEDPLVRIVDDLRFCRCVGNKVVAIETDMLADDVGAPVSA